MVNIVIYTILDPPTHKATEGQVRLLAYQNDVLILFFQQLI